MTRGIWILAAALGVCGGACTPSVTAVKTGWVDGAERLLTSSPDDSTWEEPWGTSLVAQDEASRDLGCPVAQLHMSRPYKRAWIGEGCGHRGVFLTVAVSGTYGPNDEYHWWWRAVDLGHLVEPTPTPLGPVSRPSSALINTQWPKALLWASLVKRGAADLACPADQVTPDYLPQGRAPAVPLVEGCGKRATYLSDDSSDALRLSAIVPMAP